MVELIIVIAIIAVLAVSAFMMLTKWLGKSRDSRRLSDLGTIQKGLDVGFTDVDMGNGYYPDISTQDGVVLLYSGTDTEKLAYQGIADWEVAKLANLQKVPLDPTDKNEYTYSVTANFKKFQLMAMLEDGTEAIAMINQTYAQDLYYRNRTPRVAGYNLGVLMKSGTNMPIQFVGASLTGIDLSDNTEIGEYIAKSEDGEEPVVGTGIQELEIYRQETETTQSTPTPTPTPTNSSTVTSTECESVGWEWVSSVDDVYIGTAQGDGFCISPTVDLSDTGDGYGGISWNGWGNNTHEYYKGWDASTVDDTANPEPQYGQTRKLDTPSGYICKDIGTATKGFTTGTTVGVTDGTDTILNRMKYIAVNKNSHTNMMHTAIDWVDFNGSPPVNNHVIPALFLADCIDGLKDLGTDMTVYYMNGLDNTDVVLYSDYNKDESANTETIQLSNSIYQDRQKYLLGWTQKKGSHLPSAYSYIESGTAGGGKGEYQVAYEKADLDPGIIAGIDDRASNEYIWLASIGISTGKHWGYYSRVVSGTSLAYEIYHTTGVRNSYTSARFVVR